MLLYDNVFKIAVYVTSIYFIFSSSIYISICGFTILLSHFYKDLKKIDTWPKWTEPIGFIIGLTLLYEGLKIHNYFSILIGFMKCIAHIRQIILNDNRYYY